MKNLIGWLPTLLGWALLGWVAGSVSANLLGMYLLSHGYEQSESLTRTTIVWLLMIGVAVWFGVRRRRRKAAGHRKQPGGGTGASLGGQAPGSGSPVRSPAKATLTAATEQRGRNRDGL